MIEVDIGSIGDVNRLPSHLHGRIIHWVYLLECDGEICYVGQSTDLSSRVSTHYYSNKKFNRLHYCECDNWLEASNVEAKMIVKYNPPNNKTLPANEVYMTHTVARKVFEDLSLSWVNSLPVAFERLESRTRRCFIEKSIVDDVSEQVSKLIMSRLDRKKEF